MSIWVAGRGVSNLSYNGTRIPTLASWQNSPYPFSHDKGLANHPQNKQFNEQTTTFDNGKHKKDKIEEQEEDSKNKKDEKTYLQQQWRGKRGERRRVRREKQNHTLAREETFWDNCCHFFL